MALNNLLSRRQTVLLPGGAVNAGGQIDVFEVNTAIRVTTYKDSALTAPNANPVVLDAAGKASIWIAVDCDLDFFSAADLATPYVSESAQNPDALGNSSASGLVPNGSFETDSDANDEPDGWTRSNDAGSSNGLDVTKSTDGLQSMRFTSTGTGGGNIISDDFFAVNDVQDLSVRVDIESSVVDVRNIVRIEWFDASMVTISNTDVYDEAVANPTTFETQNLTGTPPANARFAKIRLIGCDPSDATVGSTWFDRLNVFYPLIVSGQFDNILISGNEIESTDTNGDINIKPNGTGQLALFGNTKTKGADTARNTTITQSADPDLAGWGLEPSAVYRLSGVLQFEGNGATANGFRWSFDFNGQVANVANFSGASWSFAASGNVEADFIGNLSQGTLQTKATFDGAGVREKVIIDLSIQTAAGYVAGTAIDLQWAQGTSDATDTSLEFGSQLTLVRVA